MALSHAIGDKVEAAYRRGELLEKRRSLMEDWQQFCNGASAKPRGEAKAPPKTKTAPKIKENTQ